MFSCLLLLPTFKMTIYISMTCIEGKKIRQIQYFYVLNIATYQLGLDKLLEQLIGLREKKLYLLLVYSKRYKSGTAEWKRYIVQVMRGGYPTTPALQCIHQPRSSLDLSFRVLIKVPLHRQDWLNHCSSGTNSIFIPSFLPGG